jgi:hypothetical protein
MWPRLLGSAVRSGTALVKAGADINLLENDRYDGVTIASVADDEEFRDALRRGLCCCRWAPESPRNTMRTWGHFWRRRLTSQLTSRYDGTYSGADRGLSVASKRRIWAHFSRRHSVGALATSTPTAVCIDGVVRQLIAIAAGAPTGPQ